MKRTTMTLPATPVPPSRVTSAQQSLLSTILLHLLPGACIGIFYLLAAPWVMGLGFPAEFALLLGFLFIGIPLEMGILLWLGKKRNGVVSLRGIVLYRDKMPLWQYAVFFFPILIYALALAVVLSPVQDWLATQVFGWLPLAFLPQPDSQVVTVATLLTALLLLVLDGLVNPIVEECYFRGFLLPRLAHLGWYAPLINALLFTLGHVWQVYNYPLIFLSVLPEVGVVFWKRNIRFSMLCHCVANTLGAILTLVALLSVQ